MTGQDIDRLFELLAIFRPKDKHLENQALKNAWLFVLKPYSVDDVREAVAQYFRESSYWPDVTEIAKRCPPVSAAADNIPAVPDGWEKQDETLKRFEELKKRRREAGIPADWEEAREAGLTVAEYEKITDEAGLGVEVCLWL